MAAFIPFSQEEFDLPCGLGIDGTRVSEEEQNYLDALALALQGR